MRKIIIRKFVFRINCEGRDCFKSQGDSINFYLYICIVTSSNGKIRYIYELIRYMIDRFVSSVRSVLPFPASVSVAEVTDAYANEVSTTRTRNRTRGTTMARS